MSKMKFNVKMLSLSIKMEYIFSSFSSLMLKCSHFLSKSNILFQVLRVSYRGGKISRLLIL